MSKDALAYVGDVRDVRIVATLAEPGPYNRLWQPFIAKWRQDHLIVAYGLHLTGKIDMGDIVCAISTDDGGSWEEPVMILDHRIPLGPRRFAYANPVLYHPPGQHVVWCYAMRCPLHYHDSEDSELCAAYSVDGGYSWQSVELAVDYHGAAITCAGIVEARSDIGRRYLLPVHRNTRRHDPKGDQVQFVLESTSLLEWTMAGVIPQPEGVRVFMHEGNIAPDGEGGVLTTVMRTAKYGAVGGSLEPPTAYSSTSRDGGRTWSPGRPEPALHNTVSKAYYGRDALGNAVYVYSMGPYRERRGLGYCVKPPGGDWSAPRTFYDAGVCNSYPTLLELAPSEFYAVWDSSGSAERKRTAIRFGKLSLN